MLGVRLVLALLTATLASAAGSGRPTFRSLAQQSCDVVASCARNRCYFERRRWRCSSCLPGFVLTSDKTACACPAGQYKQTVGCRPCPKDRYCSGRGNPLSCPKPLVTISTGAASLQQCVNPPGYRYRNSGTRPSAVPCGPNEHSVGFQKQPTCSACPPGTATDPANVVGVHVNSSVCMAGPGYFQQSSGDVVPCPVGQFKSGYTGPEVGCTSCEAAGRSGFMTVGVGSASALDCIYVLPGYTAVVASNIQLFAVSSNTAPSSITAKPCPHDHWCPGGLPTVTGYARPCSADLSARNALRTQAVGATSQDQCVAPPGFIYVSGSVVECGNGQYKEGWDRRSTCTPCGSNLAPSEDPADATLGWKSDQTMKVPIRDPNNGQTRTAIFTRGNSTSCYIRRGMGALAGPDGSLSAVACSGPFYGPSSAKRYGLSSLMCRSCPTNQVTSCPPGDTTCAADLAVYAQQYVIGGSNVTAYFDQRACRHPPGYGSVTTAWASTTNGKLDVWVVASGKCPQGYYSAGGTNGDCQACAFFLLTAAEGATSINDCVAPPGFRFFNVTTSPTECTDGTYQASYTTAVSCDLCGLGGLWKSAKRTILLRPNADTGIPLVTYVRGSADYCYLLPGSGTSGSGPAGSYTSIVCNTNNYGISNITWGNGANPCTACPAGTVTSCSTVGDAAAKAACQTALDAAKDAGTGGHVSAQACRNLPGYGTGNGVTAQCPVGSYSTGGTTGSCSACPAWVTTDNFSQLPGMTQESDCYACSYGMTLDPATIPGTAASTCVLRAGKAAVSTASAASSACPSTTTPPNTCLSAVAVIYVTGLTDCPRGYYCMGGSPASGGVPHPCPVAGLTTAGTGGTSLSSCTIISARLAPAGGGGSIFYTVPADITLVTSTTACPAGYYCSGSASVLTVAGLPQLCTKNLTSLAGSASSEDCNIISAGQAAVDTFNAVYYTVPPLVSAVRGTTTCPAGYYCPGGASVLTAAGLPQQCTKNLTSLAGSFSSEQCNIISAGQAAVDTSNAVYYTTPASLASVKGTTACPAGYYCPGGASVLTAAGLPQQCTRSLTSLAGSASTEQCNIVSAGQAAVDSGGATYYTAPATLTAVQGTTACPAGYYCPGGASVLTAAGLPQQCTKNLTSLAGSSNSNECNIISAGQAAVDLSDAIFYTVPVSLASVKGTAACPANYYCPGGASVLTPAGLPQACGVNMVTQGAGNTAATNCVAPPGFYYNSTSNTAVACPDGTYKATYDRATTCVSCGASTSTAPRDSAHDCAEVGIVVQSTGVIYTSTGTLANWDNRGNLGSYSSASLDQSGRYAVVARATADTAGHIWFSSDVGVTWTSISDTARNWIGVAINNAGNMIVAVAANNAQVWRGITTNGGTTWTWSSITGSSGQGPWSSVAISGNGYNILAAAGTAAPARRLWAGTSTDGITYSWASATSGGTALVSSGTWTSVAVADDGTDMAAVQTSGDIYVSYDSGATFVVASGTGYPGGSPRSYLSVACNVDCTRIVVARQGVLSLLQGEVWQGVLSAGAWTWSRVSSTLLGNWREVASSTDGLTLAAGSATVTIDPGLGLPLQVTLGSVWVSVNGGGTWNRAGPTVGGLLEGDWTGLALSG